MPAVSTKPTMAETPKKRASRPSSPGPCRRLAVGHGGREGQDRDGLDVESEVGAVSAGAASVGSSRGVAPHERRELRVGSGVGQVGHQILMRGRPGPGLLL